MIVPAATPTRLGSEERAAVEAAVQRVIATGPWIGGVEVFAFEAELGAVLGQRNLLGCASGTDALTLALSAVDLAPGARVLVPGHDGGYGATAARLAGLEPVAVDVDPQTSGPTVATLEAAGSAAALIVAHLHGDAVDLASIDAWRRERGMVLVEDCAQSIGAPGTGTTGDAAAYSFYPTKNLGAIGDAGAVAFGSAEVGLRAKQLAQYGWGDRYRIELAGGRNSRLDPLQAAVLRARLPFLAARTARRREVRARYVSAAPGLRFLGGPEGVAHHAVVHSDERDRLAAHLESHGVTTAIHYPVAVADMPGLHLSSTATPEARRLAESIVSLPCTPELTDDEVDHVIEALKGWDR